jgi:hypothetical protein
MSADVRQALVEKPIGMTRDELFGATGAPNEKNFFALLSQLKGVGKIRIGGERSGEPYYVIDKWPESSLQSFLAPLRNRPDVVVTPKPEHTPRKKPTGEPSPPPATTEPNGAHFGISAEGELGIEKDDTKIKLNRAEFAVLRQFVEKTEEVWK